MLIYVLKVFDIVIAIAPGSVQDDANVIALAMWRTSFGGVNDFGLGSAIAVFLFLLVIPILARERPPLPERGLEMATTPVVITESTAARIVRNLARTPVYFLLAFIGLLWLVPTFGLFFTSVLDPSVIGRTGWWEVLSKPSQATFDNYREIFDNEAITPRS